MAIGAAIAILKSDLGTRQTQAAELKGLIARLEVYAANGTAPPPVKHAGGRPVIDPAEAQRANKRDAIRWRRARFKAEAAAAPPPAKPKKAKPRRKKPKRGASKRRSLPPIKRPETK